MDRAPTVSQLLRAWEQACSQTPVQRALTLLALAAPEEPVADLMHYTIGRRDQVLLNLREQIFGSDMNSTAQCQACGLSVEVDFSVEDIRTESASAPDEVHRLQHAGYDVHFRLPNGSDLAALDPLADREKQHSNLVWRCVTEARLNGESLPPTPLPEAVTDALSTQMGNIDPQGDIQLTLTCPQCGECWVSPLDVPSYLWREINAWAGRTLREVHELASAYGWREGNILALSPERRHAYLEMIRS